MIHPERQHHCKHVEIYIPVLWAAPEKSSDHPFTPDHLRPILDGSTTVSAQSECKKVHYPSRTESKVATNSFEAACGGR